MELVYRQGPGGILLTSFPLPRHSSYYAWYPGGQALPTTSAYLTESGSPGVMMSLSD